MGGVDRRFASGAPVSSVLELGWDMYVAVQAPGRPYVVAFLPPYTVGGRLWRPTHPQTPFFQCYQMSKALVLLGIPSVHSTCTGHWFIFFGVYGWLRGNQGPQYAGQAQKHSGLSLEQLNKNTYNAPGPLIFAAPEVVPFCHRASPAIGAIKVPSNSNGSATSLATFVFAASTMSSVGARAQRVHCLWTFLTSSAFSPFGITCTSWKCEA